jgi:hypothetical protein
MELRSTVIDKWSSSTLPTMVASSAHLSSSGNASAAGGARPLAAEAPCCLDAAGAACLGLSGNMSITGGSTTFRYRAASCRRPSSCAHAGPATCRFGWCGGVGTAAPTSRSAPPSRRPSNSRMLVQVGVGAPAEEERAASSSSALWALHRWRSAMGATVGVRLFEGMEHPLEYIFLHHYSLSLYRT